jgi:iron complex transport system ATP-binding protein
MKTAAGIDATGDVLECLELLSGAHFERREITVALRLDSPWQVLSSAVLGGGWRHARSLVHLHVPLTYRGDRPERELRDVASSLALTGPTVGLMTAVDLAHTQVMAGVAEGAAVRALVTVGLGNATRPGEPPTVFGPGTINAIVLIDRQLRAAAVVELAVVLAEAKAAALVEAGFRTPGGARASGTSTDAIAVFWRRTAGREIRHGGAATELGLAAGAMMATAIASELARPDANRMGGRS